MDKDAIIHRPMSEYAFGTDENTTVFRLRCASGGAERCTLWYGDTSCPETPVPFYPAPMRLLFRGENCDWWEAELHGKFHRLYYYFELSGGETLFFSGGVFFSTPSEERSEYFKFPFNHRADITRVPDWANDAVVYNIFPDSFASSKCAVTGVGSEKRLGCALSRSRLGGTINGIRSNLDYIASLGVNCLYLNPVFAAGQYHKYDTIDYLHIDPCFGTDEDFRALVDESHVRGIRVILDGVFNHCAHTNPIFVDTSVRGRESPYWNWFFIEGERSSFDECNYKTFADVPYMPKLNTDCDEVIDYFCGVGRYWIEQFGADGWRLDVSDEISMRFLRRFREAVKAAKPEAIIIGEVWHGAQEFLRGDMYDGVMNYGLTKACLDLLAFDRIDAAGFASRLCLLLWRNIGPACEMMFNLLDSHDTERFLTRVNGDARREAMALAVMFFFPGMPMLFAGDEIGTEGGYDPGCRRCFRWERESWDAGLYGLVQRLAALKKGLPHQRERGRRRHRARPRRAERNTVPQPLERGPQSVRRDCDRGLGYRHKGKGDVKNENDETHCGAGHGAGSGVRPCGLRLRP